MDAPIEESQMFAQDKDALSVDLSTEKEGED